MRRSKYLAALIALFALFFGLVAAPLAAQSTAEDGSDFEVLRVDLTADTGLVAFRPNADAEAGTGLIANIEGEQVAADVVNLTNSPIDQLTVLVVDNSETADTVTGYTQIRDAALAYLDTVPAGTEVMLIFAGEGSQEVRPAVAFTADHSRIREALSSSGIGSAPVTWNAVSTAASAFAGAGDGVRSVVVFAGSEGAASSVAPSVAQGALLSANASLNVVRPDIANLGLADFRAVSNAVPGGVFLGGSGDMAEAASDLGAIHSGTLVGRFSTGAVEAINTTAAQGGAGTTQIIFEYGSASERVRIVPDGIAVGSGLVPPPLAETSRFDILSGSGAGLIAIALAVVAVLMFSYAMLSIFAGDDDTLNNTLAAYGPQDAAASAAEAEFQTQRAKIIEQVVEKAEEAAAARGNLGETTSLLEKAEIPLRVGEAFAIQVGLVVAALFLGFVLSGGNIFSALALGVLAAVIPTMYIKFKVGRRAKALEKQLPDTLNLLASTLKAGYSFVQGMDAVGNEGDEPLAGEFRRTVNEARLGKDLDVALDDLAERVGSIDLLWAIVAIKIQREVGGNLAELLTTVADTMTARTRLRGEVAALTAEGRVSALVLMMLPFGLGVAMYFLNPDYISILWSGTFGFAAIGGALFSMAVGGLWMRKIIDIEI